MSRFDNNINRIITNYYHQIENQEPILYSALLTELIELTTKI